MRIIVTTKSFDRLKQFDFLIPSMASAMEGLINQLINLDGTPINVEGLNAVHFTDNYREELFAFQQSVGHRSFATLNKIADGHAQVVTVKEGQGNPGDEGYHIFFDKLIPMAIQVGQFCENNKEMLQDDLVRQLISQKNEYARMIRHELVHVEDHNNQRKWEWLEPAFAKHNLQTCLRYDAYRLWEEFYACRRSNFIYDCDLVKQETDSLLNNLLKAEQEICDLRWKYNTQKIDLNGFVDKLHEYIRSAFIYCCYFAGHMDKIYDSFTASLQIKYPSRFYHFFGSLWETLRQMQKSYPDWTGPEIYDGLADIVLQCINEFEVYPHDTEEGPYYEIPVKQLKTKLDEAREKTKKGNT